MRLGMAWLGNALDDETLVAEPAKELFPSMKEFHGSRLAMPKFLITRSEWTIPIVGFDQCVVLSRWTGLRLQTHRLLVLAHIDAAPN